jgi:Uma2 family endonuclease
MGARAVWNTANLDPDLLIDPQTKPATEFVLDQYVQKVSPRGRHAFAQAWFARAFYRFAEEAGRGRSGTEWDFLLAPPGEKPKQLVPDIAYVSYDRIAYEDDAAAEIPRVAPNIAVEILSPGDRRDVRREKIRIYLAAGSELVLFVDPEQQAVTAFVRSGERRYLAHEIVTHPAMPGLTFSPADIFRKPPPPK